MTRAASAATTIAGSAEIRRSGCWTSTTDSRATDTRVQRSKTPDPSRVAVCELVLSSHGPDAHERAGYILGFPSGRNQGGRLPHTVVIGGGICGLAAGLTLAERGQQVTVLEAQDFLGGLAATLRGTTGAGFDFGPHAYHARNQRVLDLFKEIAYDGFPARAKNVRIKFRGKYYKYPLEALDIARGMSPFLAARAFLDYTGEVMRRKLRPRSLFFGPYTTNVWGVPPSELAASFAQHRIPHISLAKVVVSSLRKGRAKVTGSEHRYAPLVVELFYPPKGAGLISQRMSERIRRAAGANEVCLGSLVTGLDGQSGHVVAVRYRAVPRTDHDGQLCLVACGTEPNGNPFAAARSPEQRIACDRIVNSIPLPALIGLLGD